MPSFLYYRPQQINPVALTDLAAWGLGYAFSADPEQTVCQGDTPDGGSGIVFHDHTRAGDAPLKMDRQAQTWDVCGPTGCYVGFWNDAKPAAADLARPIQLRGYPVELADGQQWQIPLTRQFNQTSKLFDCALPVSMKCGADGKWTRGQVLAIYRRLWDITAAFADDFAAQLLGDAEPRNFSDDEVCTTAVELLSANYVVSAGELSLLGALPGNDLRIMAAIYAACDSPTLLPWFQLQKKTIGPSATVGVNTSAGAAG